MVRKEIENTLYDRSWVSTATQKNTYIFDESLSFNPSDIFVSTDTADDDTPMYTRKQMLQMFRFGYETKTYGPYKILRKMKVGDVAVFPYDSWDVVRAAIARIKKNEGRVFTTKKLGPFGKKGDIKIIRES